MSDVKMKMVIVIRDDLKMTGGKPIAQGIHAAMGALRASKARWGPIGPDMLGSWDENGRKQAILAVGSEEALLALSEAAESLDLGNYLVRDHGRTQVAPDTPTALGIGPDFEDRIDRVTGALAPYR